MDEETDDRVELEEPVRRLPAEKVGHGGTVDAKNVVQVQIFGHSYTIRGEAERDYIMGVAAYVDQKMREITEKLPVASLSKVAILASLNIADELFKERSRREDQEHDLNRRAARLNAVLDGLLEDRASR